MNHSRAYEITLTKQGVVTLFDIKGEMTAFSETSLSDAYKRANEGETKNIILNFNRDAYIDSAGIALLIQLLAQTQKRNQLICMTGLSNHFVKIFNMVGITRYAEIHDNIETAMEALISGQHLVN
jgi:anti-anti-sigma factor